MGLRGEQGAAAGSRDAAPEWPSMVQRVARVRGARAIAFALAAALCCGSPRAAGAARCSDFEENGAACGSGGACGAACGGAVGAVCLDDPPVNGTGVNGTASVIDYACFCPQGLGGLRCRDDLDECWSGPCQNGGECQDEGNSYTCVCANGFSGTNCDQASDPDPAPGAGAGSCPAGTYNWRDGNPPCRFVYNRLLAHSAREPSLSE